MDQYSRAWMQSSEGRAAMAARSRAAERAQNREEEYKKFWQLADEKARQLEFVPDELFRRKRASSINYEYFYSPVDLFPNYEQVFPDYDSRIISLTIYDSIYDKEEQNVYGANVERKNLMEAAFKRRVSHYFYEDIKDFNKEGMLDLFIDYLNLSKDFDFEKMAKNPALSDEQIKTIVEKLHSADRSLLQINLFMAHPKAFTSEQAEKIIKVKWFYANCITGGQYDPDIYYPSHTGMAQSDVEFRQKLDAISKEMLGKSIYELNFNGQTYFDKLWTIKQYDELLAEHYDEFLAKVKSENAYGLLIENLSFEKDGMLADRGRNKYFLPIIDSAMTSEKEVNLSDTKYGYNQKIMQYMQNRALQGKILNRNTLKNIVDSRTGSVADFLFAHKDELNKDVLKALYEDAWLYAQGPKSAQELKKEYHELFGKNIEDVRETWDRKHAVGSSRFDILLQNRDVEKILSEYPDEFLKLPAEKTKEIIKNISISCDENLQVELKDKPVLNFANEYIEKYGLNVFLENVPDYKAKEFLAVRYMQGVREPKEIEYLRKYFSRNDVLETEFNKSGDTLMSISDVPDLLKKQKFDQADLILKRGYRFNDDEQKYECLHDFISLSLYSTEQNPKAEQYVDDFIKNAHIDWKKAEKNQYFSERETLDFMLKKYGKNPAISKKDLDYMLDKARRSENVSDNAMKKLHELGYDFKPHMAYQLIQYDGKRRAVRIDLEGKDLSQYDFEAKFLLDRPYHLSSDSHTTFLNETLQYWKKEAAVAALNNGASPFTKAGFFRDKFEAMPFNMMFSKALKENKSTELKEFMGYIAANLDESKKGVLKDIWTSLGQKLRDDARVQGIIRDTDKILKSRDFIQERIDKQLKLKAEEERRKQEEARRKLEEEKARIEREKRLAEQKRREEEYRKEEEKRKHKEDIARLTSNILLSLAGIEGMDNKTIVQNIANYLEQNKSELPVVPNADELSAIKIAAFEKKTEALKLKQMRDEEKQIQMNIAIQSAIAEKEHESAAFLSPKEVSEFVTKYFEKDAEAKPFINSTIKKFSEAAQEKAEIQKKIDRVDQVAADKLLDFYEADDTHGFDYFTAVGKERRNQGYTNITVRVMHEMNLPLPIDDSYHSQEQDVFDRVKDKVIKLIDKTNEQSYYDESKNVWVDNRYDYLADMAGYEPEEPKEPKVDEKELIKQAKKEVKKNKKGESVVNSLAGLAALKDKFGNTKD